MRRPRVFLAYPFKYPEIEETVRNASQEFADVLVAKDEVHGAHILDKIARQMNESDACLFDLTGNNVNVVLELGMAIGRGATYCVMRQFDAATSDQDAEFFSDLKGWDHIRYATLDELVHKLRAYLPKQLHRARSEAAPTRLLVPETTYETEIVESLNHAWGQSGLMIPSYVCAMSLAVHPTSYSGDRFSEVDERDIIRRARDSIRLNFPIQSPDGAVNLRDGFQVTTVLERDGARPEFREYYRFRRDGLFVLTRVSPDDIDEHRQYPGNDRYIGFGTLVSTITKMTRFAAALSHQFADDTTAMIRVSGLAGHRIVDDTPDKMLTIGELPFAHEERIESEFSGTPDDFAKSKDDWAAEAVSKCLRLLNYPAVPAVAKATVIEAQKRIA